MKLIRYAVLIVDDAGTIIIPSSAKSATRGNGGMCVVALRALKHLLNRY